MKKQSGTTNVEQASSRKKIREKLRPGSLSAIVAAAKVARQKGLLNDIKVYR